MKPVVRPFIPLLAGLLLFGCQEQGTPKPDPHYVLGPPYQVSGFWFYPAESYSLKETGLAAILPDGKPRLTTNGEAFDQSAMAAGHPTLQLPSIARVTNLENGLQTTVRINDRGSGNPARLVELTQRAAVLLGIPDGGTARVRLEVLQGETRAAVEALPGAPNLGVKAAPRDSVQAADLPPPPGVVQGTGRTVTASANGATPSLDAGAAPPLRLPETVTRTMPQPGLLMIWLDAFPEQRYAAQQRAKMADAGARIVTVRQPRQLLYRTEIGPIGDVTTADSILRQAFARGIPDARIVVN
ncbi:MAG: sporulation and cell division repeat protein [Proteobacteria bacterium]|nr:sporulation and cell division repeat protein [Pseudomonadota bacterium]